MKRLFYILLIISLTAGLSGCEGSVCPTCGRKNVELQECPVCHTMVCSFCADDDHYLEELYNSGRMEQYLEKHGYVVLPEQQDAFCIYAYGFISGYTKGSNGVQDSEVDEFSQWDYEYLQQAYGEYGW